MGGAVQQIGVVAAAVAASFIPDVGPYAATGVLVAGGMLLGPDPETPSVLNLDPGSPSRGVLLNKASNNAPIPVVYGTRRVGGTRVFIEVTGSGNEYLHVVLALCEGEIQAVDTVYLDDVPTTDSRFSGLVDVYKHLGADGQVADSNLVSSAESWTNDHRLRGTAYVYLRLKWNSDAFGGLPTITCDVQGKKVFDPRDETVKFSSNPALCIRDYLVNARYGRGIPESMIDDDSFEAAANYCDEDVTVAGNVQDRYTCDGVVDIDKSSLEIVKKMLTSCRGALIFSGGLYRLKIDKPESAAFTFDEDNIIGA